MYIKLQNICLPSSYILYSQSELKQGLKTGEVSLRPCFENET